MHTIIKTSLLLISLTSVVLLSGCATPGKNTLPHGEMTMTQIYRAQTGLAKSGNRQAYRKKRSANRRARQEGRLSSVVASANDHHTDLAQNQLNGEFKVLPNPNIAVYIFPHLSHYGGTNVPVPGYTTTFFLYEKNHYAMPGEAY
jgi:conjugative transfer region lipoprotein (TIGR03751 family)